MRIAIGQLWQETNTFNPIATTRADFEQFGVSRGDAMLAEMATTNELGGFIQSLRAWPEKPEIVGLVRLPAWPSGTITIDTFDWLKTELIDALRDAMPVDAVLLALHGAMAAEGHSDVEGEILTELRSLVGGQVPIVATLDLHANLTLEMVRATDALVIYHCAPHVDVYETGERGAAVLRRILVDGARPVTAFQKVPAVLPVEKANTETDCGVSVDLKRRLKDLESRGGVLSAGLTTVQPWMDIPGLGSAVLVTTDNGADLAASSCAKIADELWSRRGEYLPELTSIEEAVRCAHELRDGLMVLSDPADATTSGAPGDSVWILRELRKYQWPAPVLVPLVAPDVVDDCGQIAAGALIDMTLGGIRDSRFGTTLPLRVEIGRTFDASFVMSGHIGKNMAIDMGRSVVLRVLSSSEESAGKMPVARVARGEIRVIVTSRSGPHFAPEFFRAAGFDPFEAAVVVAKSPCGFRAVYADRAKQIFSVRAPGCAPSDFWNYSYEKIPRPLWPWDAMVSWNASPTIVHLRSHNTRSSDCSTL